MNAPRRSLPGVHVLLVFAMLVASLALLGWQHIQRKAAEAAERDIINRLTDELHAVKSERDMSTSSRPSSGFQEVATVQVKRKVWLGDQKFITDQLNYINEAEGQNMEKFNSLFSAKCTHENSTFVDSGANEGFWSMLAAAYGCKVVAVEPQPLCCEWIKKATTVNGFQSQITLHNNALASESFTLTVRKDECAGTSQYKSSGEVVDSFDEAGHKSKDHSVHDPALGQAISTVSLDSLVPDGHIVELWHLDTEGAEIGVLKSATQLFKAKRIRRLVVEWLPDMWPKYGVSLDEGVRMAATLLGDYDCVNSCGHPADFSQKQGGLRTRYMVYRQVAVDSSLPTPTRGGCKLNTRKPLAGNCRACLWGRVPTAATHVGHRSFTLCPATYINIRSLVCRARHGTLCCTGVHTVHHAQQRAALETVLAALLLRAQHATMENRSYGVKRSVSTGERERKYSQHSLHIPCQTSH